MKRTAITAMLFCSLVAAFSSCKKATRNWIKGGWTMDQPIQGGAHMNFIDDNTVVVSLLNDVYSDTFRYERSSTTLQLTEPNTGYVLQTSFTTVDMNTFRVSNFLPIENSNTLISLEFKRD